MTNVDEWSTSQLRHAVLESFPIDSRLTRIQKTKLRP
jgi:hypothetical protein